MPDDQNTDNIITALGQMMTQVDQKFDQIISHVDQKNDDVMTKMDQVYTEVLAMRQEQSSHQLQHEDINKDLEGIRAIPAIAHELKRK